MHEYGCITLLFPFTSVVCIASATLKLHSPACSAWIKYSCCLNFVDRITSVVFSSVNAASRFAVSDENFMKEDSISPCFTLLTMPYPAAPDICSSSYLSRYYSWKCASKHTHVQSLAAMILQIQYACVYSCVARILATPMSTRCRFEKWRIYRYWKFLTCIHPVEQDFYWTLDVICHLHLVLILYQVSRSYLAVPNIYLVHKFN